MSAIMVVVNNKEAESRHSGVMMQGKNYIIPADNSYLYQRPLIFPHYHALQSPGLENTEYLERQLLIAA